MVRSFEELRYVLNPSLMKDLTLDNRKQVPSAMFMPVYLADVTENLSNDQKTWISNTGFGSLLNFQVKDYPTDLCYFIIDTYDPSIPSFQLEETSEKISEKDVNDVLGLPMGSKDIHFTADDCFTDELKQNYNFQIRNLLPNSVCDVLKQKENVDDEFKINYLILLWNTLIQGSTNQFLDLKMVNFEGNLDQCTDYNWCKCLLDCLKASWISWTAGQCKTCFNGSIPFLLFLFLERFATKKDMGTTILPAYLYWTDGVIERLMFEDFFQKVLSDRSLISEALSLQDENADADATANRIIAGVVKDIEREFFNDPDSTPEIMLSYLKEAIEEYQLTQEKCIKDLKGADRGFPTSEVVDLLRLKFIKLNEKAIGFVSKNIIQPDMNRYMVGPDLRSPFLNATLDVSNGMFVKEGDEYWKLLFSDRVNDCEIIFKWKEVLGYKLDFKSLYFGEMVMASVIDVWCCLLNLMESATKKHNINRLFCFTYNTVGIVNANKKIPLESKYKAFAENMNYILDLYSVSIENTDLVMFPMITSNHYYIVCYNLKQPSLEILDNKKPDKWIHETYSDDIDILHGHFTRFLDFKRYPNIACIKTLVAKRLVMAWQTKYNDTDCGIFAMHHLETYMGSGLDSWTTSIVPESYDQLMQLKKMRVNFLIRIHMSEFNERAGLTS